MLRFNKRESRLWFWDSGLSKCGSPCLLKDKFLA